MEMHRYDQIPDLSVRRVYRHGRLQPIVMFLIFVSAAIAVGVMTCHNARGSWQGWSSLPEYIGVGIVLLIGGLLMLLVIAALASQVRASFLPSNWFLKVCDTGLLIQFRSYLNYRLPTDVPSVVFIAFAEIASIGRTRERVAVSTGRSMGHANLDSLDIVLNHETTAELDRAIRVESGREAPPGFLGIRSKSMDVPVRVADPGVVRVDWCIRFPSLDSAIALLSGSVQTRAPVKTQPGAGLTPDGQAEQEILDAIDRGDEMTAVELVQRRYHLSLTAAHEYVEKLSAAAPEADSGGQADS
jgi:hypothetical protein